jgi:hypothetical protein
MSIMKRTSIQISSLLLLAILLGSCGETEPTIYNGTLFISFTQGTEGRFVVQNQNVPYPMQVGIPYPVEQDLKVGLKVVYATGIEGVHFDLPSSVTIRKGQVIADFYVYGHAENMTDRRDTLVIGLEHEDAATFANEFTLVMQPPCEFVLEEFMGDFTAYEQSDYEEQPYDPYTVNFAENPNGGDTLVVTGMWPGEPFKVVFHADDPSNTTWNIPDQFLLADYNGYGETRISDEGPGVVLTCDHELTIRYQIYVDEGYFERAFIRFVKD